MAKNHEQHGEHDEALVVAIGGTLVPRFAMAPMYGHLVDAFSDDVPRQDKLIALPGGGFGPMQETFEAVAEKVMAVHSQVPERPLVLVGHSQGAVHAARLAVEGTGDAVVSLAGPLRGVTFKVPFASQLRTALRNPPAERDLQEGSEYITQLNDAMRANWPATVPLEVVAATHDLIVPARAQFGVELSPSAANPRERVVMPSRVSRLGREALARVGGVPRGVDYLLSLFAVDHGSLPHATGMVALLAATIERLPR